MNSSGTTGIRFDTGASSPTTERICMIIAGNVGIGSTNPNAKVERSRLRHAEDVKELRAANDNLVKRLEALEARKASMK